MKKDTWKHRRRLVYCSLLLSFIIILYLIIYGNNSSLHETIANGSFIVIGAILNGYILGACYDDKAKREQVNKREEKQYEEY